ncbi:dipeptide epimerase [Symbiopectobacterium purcellii]|uniref:Dipeptide epimerase n=1 Tax=Symbiopectobacterium purcellii TaxID=2871826 RepID=A0ABX9AK47_9ENTR|nr:dipeptide epimerase [Symbiopectobacterium purcellii]QZN95483.1 dipeptide epimerase [Symbiopectobacterium purcellii]
MRQMQVETVKLSLARPCKRAQELRNAVSVVRITVEEQGFIGLGECTPAFEYQESAASVCRQLDAVRGAVTRGASRDEIQTLLPPGAARNALDCALWRLNAALHKQTVWQQVGIQPPASLITTETLSITSLENTVAATRDAISRGAQVIKLKLDRSDIVEKIAAVRDAAPRATLMVDATESWAGLDLLSLCHALLPYNIALIEQPLPAGKDQELLRFSHPIPLCADESCRHAGDIPGIRRRYEMINIKLDKCGGLTEALAMVREARLHGLKLMVGCLVGSSLAMEAALPVAAAADYVDLDGPLWLAADSSPYLTYHHGRIWL